MKKVFLMMIAVAVGLTATAQGKERILVDYFTGPETIKTNYIDGIRNQIIVGMQATNRLVFIDIDGEQSLKLEAERRTSEAAMGDKTARMGEMVKLGANYLLTGSVESVATAKKKDDDGTIYHDATVVFTIKVVNMKDGSLKSTKSYTKYGGGVLFGAGATEEKAITGAISLINDDMESFIDEHFPLNGAIVEVGEVKKKKLVDCYINLGEEHGVSKGQYVKVSLVKTIAGRKSKVAIGRMKVEEVVAADLSKCKVTKGGEEILKAHNDGGELLVETIKEAGVGGLMKSVGVSL